MAQFISPLPCLGLVDATDFGPEQAERLWEVLHPSERATYAARLAISWHHGAEFALARIWLKHKASQKLGCKVHRISTRSDTHGAPIMYRDDQPFRKLIASISHAAPYIATMLSYDEGCGVDVECIGKVDWSSVIRTMQWQAYLERSNELASGANWLTTEHRAAMLWTGYEAFMKCSSCRAQPSAYRPRQMKIMSMGKWELIAEFRSGMSSKDGLYSNDKEISIQTLIRSTYALSLATVGHR